MTPAGQKLSISRVGRSERRTVILKDLKLLWLRKVNEFDARICDEFLDFVVICFNVYFSDVAVNCEICSLEAYLTRSHFAPDKYR